MQLVTYKKRFGKIGRDNMMDSPSEFYDRKIESFESFPDKEAYHKMGFAAVSHPMEEEKIRLHKTGKYNPFLHLDRDEEETEDF